MADVLGRAATRRHVVLLLLLSYLFLFHGLGAYSLKEPDEGRYAEIPKEMVERGDYVVPYFNGVRYFEKPALFYWVVALSYRSLGVSEWSFRLPNALAAFLCVAALYGLGRRWFGAGAAFKGAVMLLTSFGFFSMARVVTLDMLFTLWLFLGLLCFYGYYRERKAFFLYSFYAAMALATLTKGPVGPLLMGVSAGIFLLWERNLSFLREMRWVKGLSIYFVLTLPWFLLVCLREPQFFPFFFVDQHFLRFFTSKHKRSGPLYYFVPVLFGGMLPWSLFLPRSFLTLWVRRDMRLFLVWTATVFLFFSVSGSKLPPYILPLFPSCAILLGVLFDGPAGEGLARKGEIPAFTLLCLFAAALSFLFWGGWLPDQVNSLVPRELSGRIDELRAFLLVTGCAAAAAAILCWVLPLPPYRRFLVVGTSFSSVIILTILLHNPLLDMIKTSKEISGVINREGNRIEELINYGSFYETVPFYTGRKMILAAYKGELAMGAEYDDARHLFATHEEFLDRFGSPKSVCALVKESRMTHLRPLVPAGTAIVARDGEKYLICNPSYVNKFTR